MPVTFCCSKKSNQKCRKLAKFDLEITYSLWDSLIQYTLAAPTKFFHSTLIVRQYLISPLANITLTPQTFQNTMRLQRTSSVAFFILEHVKTVPNGRFLLLSSAYRSKKKVKKTIMKIRRSKK
jgi:hypothetical protein